MTTEVKKIENKQIDLPPTKEEIETSLKALYICIKSNILDEAEKDIIQHKQSLENGFKKNIYQVEHVIPIAILFEFLISSLSDNLTELTKHAENFLVYYKHPVGLYPSIYDALLPEHCLLASKNGIIFPAEKIIDYINLIFNPKTSKFPLEHSDEFIEKYEKLEQDFRNQYPNHRFGSIKDNNYHFFFDRYRGGIQNSLCNLDIKIGKILQKNDLEEANNFLLLLFNSNLKSYFYSSSYFYTKDHSELYQTLNETRKRSLEKLDSYFDRQKMNWKQELLCPINISSALMEEALNEEKKINLFRYEKELSKEKKAELDNAIKLAINTREHIFAFIYYAGITKIDDIISSSKKMLRLNKTSIEKLEKCEGKIEQELLQALIKNNSFIENTTKDLNKWKHDIEFLQNLNLDSLKQLYQTTRKKLDEDQLRKYLIEHSEQIKEKIHLNIRKEKIWLRFEKLENELSSRQNSLNELSKSISKQNFIKVQFNETEPLKMVLFKQPSIITSFLDIREDKLEDNIQIKEIKSKIREEKLGLALEKTTNALTQNQELISFVVNLKEAIKDHLKISLQILENDSKICWVEIFLKNLQSISETSTRKNYYIMINISAYFHSPEFTNSPNEKLIGLFSDEIRKIYQEISDKFVKATPDTSAFKIVKKLVWKIDKIIPGLLQTKTLIESSNQLINLINTLDKLYSLLQFGFPTEDKRFGFPTEDKIRQIKKLMKELKKEKKKNYASFIPFMIFAGGGSIAIGAAIVLFILGFILPQVAISLWISSAISLLGGLTAIAGGLIIDAFFTSKGVCATIFYHSYVKVPKSSEHQITYIPPKKSIIPNTPQNEKIPTNDNPITPIQCLN